MPTLKEREAERKESMRKLSELLERRQRYVNSLQQGEQADIDRLANERAMAAKNWGGDVVKGGVMGGSMSGSPWGALIGGIAGAASGQKRAYEQRRKEGESGGGAFFKSIFDIPGSLPTMDTATGVAPAAASGYAGYKSRTQGMPTAQQDIANLSPEQQQIKDRYYQGVEETGPDPYADIWSFEESKRRKGLK